MSKWNTEWITHPDYPGWRKRRLVSKDGMTRALIHTNWERIPGSDPTLPGPPGSESWKRPDFEGLFPKHPRPDWGKFPEGLPKLPYRPPSHPGMGDRPGPDLPPLSPRRPPGWHNLPEKFPDGFNPFLRPHPYRPPHPPSWGKFPERLEPDFWKDKYPFFPKWKDKGIDPIKPMPMPGTLPGIWDKFPRRKFDGNEKDFLQLLKDAQIRSAMPKYHSGQRKNIRDLSTEMATDPLSYVSDNVRGPQLGGVPEGDRKFVNTMHAIQNAYFTGADFGYEEGWTDRLGATQEQIDMFMAVPEEAFQYAMENPTDDVLMQFEEYYGFPLNVNDPDMQKYFDHMKKRR